MVEQHPETFTAGLLLGQLPTVDLRGPLIKRVIAGEIDIQTVRGIVRDVMATAVLPVQASSLPPVAAHAKGEEINGARVLSSPSNTDGGPPPAAEQLTIPPASTAQRNRVERHSTRALGRATQTLEALMTQLYQIVPRLQPNERAQLRDVLLEHHIPAVKQVIRDLAEPGESAGSACTFEVHLT